jgi:hypothetical protein
MSVLNDKTLLKTFAWVDELNNELTMLQKSDKAWQTTQVAAEVLQELTVQQSVAAADAGKVARDRVVASPTARCSRRQQDQVRDPERQGREAVGRVGRHAHSSSHKEEPIIVDDEHFQWKFNGEYWKDELGYYRFKIRSRCPRIARVFHVF